MSTLCRVTAQMTVFCTVPIVHTAIIVLIIDAEMPSSFVGAVCVCVFKQEYRVAQKMYTLFTNQYLWNKFK